MGTALISFLDLPFEVRLQIYKLALQPSRLCTNTNLDPEWLFAPDRGCRVAPLLFASRQIYLESAPIFYARATLEVTPCQHDPSDARHLAEFLRQYEDDHAFCPPRYLQLITSVHVYGGQVWPVDQDAFQALFQWLIIRTGVKCIYLSMKTMQQGRHIPELVNLDNLAYDVATQKDDRRVIDIYARNVSSRLRFVGNAGINRTKPLPSVQLYLTSPWSESPQLYREPSWTRMMAETAHAVDASHDVEERWLKRQMERFALNELGDAFLRQAHTDGYLWLYKTVQIVRGDAITLNLRNLSLTTDMPVPITQNFN